MQDLNNHKNSKPHPKGEAHKRCYVSISPRLSPYVRHSRVTQLCRTPFSLFFPLHPFSCIRILLLSGAEFVERKSHFLILPNLGLGIQFTNFLSLSLSSYSFPSSDKFSLSLFLSLADYDNHFSSIYPFPKETWFYFPGKILLTVFWANLSSFISFLLRFVVEFQFPRFSRSIY